MVEEAFEVGVAVVVCRERESDAAVAAEDARLWGGAGVAGCRDGVGDWCAAGGAGVSGHGVSVRAMRSRTHRTAPRVLMAVARRPRVACSACIQWQGHVSRQCRQWVQPPAMGDFNDMHQADGLRAVAVHLRGAVMG